MRNSGREQLPPDLLILSLFLALTSGFCEGSDVQEWPGSIATRLAHPPYLSGTGRHLHLQPELRRPGQIPGPRHQRQISAADQLPAFASILSAIARIRYIDRTTGNSISSPSTTTSPVLSFSNAAHTLRAFSTVAASGVNAL